VSEPESGKRVSWAELYFDLVFVVAVTRVSAFIEHDHSWGGVLRAVIVFVPVYWLWVGMAIQTNQQDTSRVILRLRLFAVALAAVFMAASLDDSYGRLGLLFAVAYWSGRIVLALPQIPLFRARRAILLNPVTVSVLFTGPLLVVGALVHGDAREVLWAVAAVLDLSTPRLLRRRMAGMRVDSGHLAERFGLFVLIALGESVVSVTTVTGNLDVATGFAIAAAFMLSAGLWWVYFHFAADAVRHALATAQVQLDITRLVLSYGHLAFIAAIIIVAVGLHDSVAAPTHALSWAVTGLLFGGTALYLATFGYTRWAMFRLVSWTRLSGAATVLVLMLFAPHVPALAALFALAVVLAVLNAVELAMVEQMGWRARLSRRRARVP
jgi:low temperature requirement protein LtrA